MRFLVLILFLFFLLPHASFGATLVPINTADATLLDSLPGIGPTRAAAIITYRKEHGPFIRVEDLDAVPGIGPTTIANLRGLVSFDLSLPTVTSTVQPAVKTESSNKSQVKERALTKKTEPVYVEEVVVAPAASAQTAAVGATVQRDALGASSILSSPWLYGFLGLLVFSGAALMVL